MNTTDEHLAGQAGETKTVQWGALVTLPTGASDVEVANDRDSAVARVGNANRTFGAEVAKLMYRTVASGPWHADLAELGTESGQWGMQITWTVATHPQLDLYQEVHPQRSRYSAELAVRAYRGEGAAKVVTRQVNYGQWWLAAAEATG